MNHTSNFNFKSTIKYLRTYLKGTHTNLNGKMVLIMLSTSTSTSQAASLRHGSKKISTLYLGDLKEKVLKQESLLLFVNNRAKPKKQDCKSNSQVATLNTICNNNYQKL